MSDQVIISLVGSFIGLVGTIFSGYMAFKMAQLNQKQDKSDARVENIATKVAEVHTLANSMKDQLVQVTEKEALARGGIEERARADVRTEKAQELSAKEAVVHSAMELKKDIAEVPEKTAALVKEPEEPKKEKEV